MNTFFMNIKEDIMGIEHTTRSILIQYDGTAEEAIAAWNRLSDTLANNPESTKLSESVTDKELVDAGFTVLNDYKLLSVYDRNYLGERMSKDGVEFCGCLHCSKCEEGECMRYGGPAEFDADTKDCYSGSAVDIIYPSTVFPDGEVICSYVGKMDVPLATIAKYFPCLKDLMAQPDFDEAKITRKEYTGND